MNFSRLYSRLSALVGRPKANPKLPSSINIALRLYGTTRTTRSDGGDYAILAPIKHGQPKPGVENGPYILKQFLPAKVRTIDPLNGMVFPPQGCETFTVTTNSVPIKNPTAVGKSNEALHRSIVDESEKLMDTYKRLPSILTLGGDHSLGIGSVSAVASICAKAISKRLPNLPFKDPELVVIWVDAHADINTPSTTMSGNLHGCPLSLLIGLDSKTWRELESFNWAFDSKYLPPGKTTFMEAGRLAYIGLRDLDDAEKYIIADKGIVAYDMSAVNAADRNMTKIINQCLQSVDPKGTRPILLSFDIDAIDPFYAPSTGTPVPGGLYRGEGAQIIEILKATGRLVAMDLTEVNPNIGHEYDVFRTLETSKDLIGALYK